jgi:hypothetical protein
MQNSPIILAANRKRRFILTLVIALVAAGATCSLIDMSPKPKREPMEDYEIEAFAAIQADGQVAKPFDILFGLYKPHASGAPPEFWESFRSEHEILASIRIAEMIKASIRDSSSDDPPSEAELFESGKAMGSDIMAEMELKLLKSLVDAGHISIDDLPKIKADINRKAKATLREIGDQ